MRLRWQFWLHYRKGHVSWTFKMLSNALVRDLQHDGRQWPSDPICIVTKVSQSRKQTKQLSTTPESLGFNGETSHFVPRLDSLVS